jgi:rhodanese-related sulfurtransferase
MQEISSKDAAGQLAAGSAIILDVREEAELLEAAVDGVLHIPMGQVPERLAELNPADNIIVMCKLGGRSAMVCDFLSSQGFGNVANLVGGIYAWAEEVDPDVLKQG